SGGFTTGGFHSPLRLVGESHCRPRICSGHSAEFIASQLRHTDGSGSVTAEISKSSVPADLGNEGLVLYSERIPVRVSPTFPRGTDTRDSGCRTLRLRGRTGRTAD